MKKLQFLSALLLFITVISCSSNDPTQNPVIQNDLLGEWNVYALSANSETANAYSTSGEVFSGDFNVDASNINATTLFKENPNNVITNGNFTANYTASFLGQNYSESYDVTTIPDYIANAEWSLDNNTISFTSQNQTILADIIFFRNDTLQLKTNLSLGFRDLNYEITYPVDSLTSNTVTIDSIRVSGNVYLTLTK